MASQKRTTAREAAQEYERANHWKSVGQISLRLYGTAKSSPPKSSFLVKVAASVLVFLVSLNQCAWKREAEHYDGIELHDFKEFQRTLQNTLQEVYEKSCRRGLTQGGSQRGSIECSQLNAIALGYSQRSCVSSKALDQCRRQH